MLYLNQETYENLPLSIGPTYATSTIQHVTPGYITTSGSGQQTSGLNRANMTTFNKSPTTGKPPGSDDLPPAYDSLYGID